MSQFWLPKQWLTCTAQMGDSSSTCSDPDMHLTPTAGRYLPGRDVYFRFWSYFLFGYIFGGTELEYPREYRGCYDSCLSTTVHRYVHLSHCVPRAWYHTAIYVSSLLVFQYSSIAIQAQLCTPWWNNPPADRGRDLHPRTCSVFLIQRVLDRRVLVPRWDVDRDCPMRHTWPLTRLVRLPNPSPTLVFPTIPTIPITQPGSMPLYLQSN